MIRAIAVDDEPIGLEIIQNYAAKVNFLDLKATFEDALEALEYIKQNPVDLVFLDINMPDITGMDFAQLLPPATRFIFTTAYSKYAVDAFQINAIDYLMKPFGLSRFLAACQRAHQIIKEEPANSDFLFVKEGYDWVRVTVEDLLYVESDGNYLTFKEKTRKILTRMTMTEAQELLPKKHFFRIHKSYMVNLNHVQKIEKHQVSVFGNQFVPIAANCRDELMEALRQIWTVK